jgi:hypothetical protein
LVGTTPIHPELGGEITERKKGPARGTLWNLFPSARVKKMILNFMPYHCYLVLFSSEKRCDSFIIKTTIILGKPKILGSQIFLTRTTPVRVKIFWRIILVFEKFFFISYQISLWNWKELG